MSRCRSISRLMTCAWIDTSSAETGSSPMMSFGLSASARAMPMRWRWPPENWCGKLSICARRSPTRSNSAATRSRRAPLASTPCTLSGSPTMSPARFRGLSEENGSWKMICICRRKGRISSLPRRVTSWPSSRMVPAVGSIRRRMARPTVVLPQPISPTSPSVSPGPIVKLTSSTA